MENKKKTIFNVVFLLVVFVGTIYGVFHGEDLGEIAQIIKTVNPLWLIPGVVCVVVFIWGESIIIYYMMHTLGIRLKKKSSPDSCVKCYTMFLPFLLIKIDVFS